ncbi:putative glucose-6-phosphate 1-epimerase [Capsicum baccatum]|uniref:Glucose-6-phosphate 1-epimerase n=1 Tax=Capsicum baccatum TaxID=33114 RepID=A0A2G2WBN5_CAPBA|nr:putative glucose-6-phosphate 1-epimerase [Capsicum baccatum]
MTSSTSEKPLVELTKGVNGLEKVVLREVRGSSAEVYLYGGQVTSWKNDHREELLFVSSKYMKANITESNRLILADMTMKM